MKKAQLFWQRIQYRGDAANIEELYKKYNVDGFLAAREMQQRDAVHSLRDRLLKDGVLLNEILSPRIFGIIRQVQAALQVDGDFDVFCVPGTNINAFAYLEPSGEQSRHVIGITSTALEQLSDEEIAFLIGHELGHFIFDHNRLLGLLNTDEHSSSITVLPHMGECLFLRWRKKSEVSADRMGLVACGSFDVAARALIKTGFGLSEKNLNLNVEALLRQIESIKDKPEMLETAYRSHPLLPLRLKSLHLFSQTMGPGKAFELPEAEDQIDALFSWFRRYPRRPIEEAAMRIVALAGMRIIGVEQDVDEEEIRTIVYLLHNFFTDTPEDELILEPTERQARWEKSVKLIREEGEEQHKIFIISRLADIALADGKLLDAESHMVMETAEQLGLTSKHAFAVIVGAAQTTGFKVDWQMKELSRKVRSQVMNAVKHGTDPKDKLF